MIVGLFAGSVVALAIFVWIELHAREPVLPIRLFRNPVFTVCCVLSFVVGFAMLGAMTFLPTFMQFVDGVSATTSGLRTLPMVVGLLLTSMGSGTIVGRTGHYKIFPVLGTAIMSVGFVLLSRMDESTSLLTQSLYLFVLGTGIGMCMQVLVLIVQNTTDFADLGVNLASCDDVTGLLRCRFTRLDVNARFAQRLVIQFAPGWSRRSARSTRTAPVGESMPVASGGSDVLSAIHMPPTQPPTNIALSGATLAENLAAGTTVGTLSATDTG